MLGHFNHLVFIIYPALIDRFFELHILTVLLYVIELLVSAISGTTVTVAFACTLCFLTRTFLKLIITVSVFIILLWVLCLLLVLLLRFLGFHRVHLGLAILIITFTLWLLIERRTRLFLQLGKVQQTFGALLVSLQIFAFLPSHAILLI